MIRVCALATARRHTRALEASLGADVLLLPGPSPATYWGRARVVDPSPPDGVRLGELGAPGVAVILGQPSDSAGAFLERALALPDPWLIVLWNLGAEGLRDRVGPLLRRLAAARVRPESPPHPVLSVDWATAYRPVEFELYEGGSAIQRDLPWEGA